MGKNKEYLQDLMKEKDKRHKAIYTAQEKAIDKAYQAQQQYNQTHNDLIRKMENMVTRNELWTLIAVIISLMGLYLVTK